MATRRPLGPQQLLKSSQSFGIRLKSDIHPISPVPAGWSVAHSSKVYKMERVHFGYKVSRDTFKMESVPKGHTQQVTREEF